MTNTSPGQSASKSPNGSSTTPLLTNDLDISDLKSEILLSLKDDISVVIKTELTVAIFPDYTLKVAEARAAFTEPTGSSIRPFIPSTAVNIA